MSGLGRLVRRLFGGEVQAVVPLQPNAPVPAPMAGLACASASPQTPAAAAIPTFAPANPQTPLTPGELRFLAGFKTSANAAHYHEQSDFWSSVTGQTPTQLLSELRHQGLIEAADPAGRLVAVYSSPQLSDLCKARNLGVSGTKAQKAKRLMKADPNGMERLVGNLEIYSCTEEGRRLVEADELRRQQEKQEAEEAAAIAFRSGQFRRAARLVDSYEAKQPIPRGMGIRWGQRETTREEHILTLIAESRPGILAGLTDGQLNELRLPAAMMFLWGTSQAGRWRPGDREGTYGRLDADTAARMLVFYAQTKYELSQLADLSRGGLKYQVEVSCASDACPTCMRFVGKRYSLARAPELPHPRCTHEMGCRCMYISVRQD